MTKTHILKPFKFDKSDDERYYDLLRGIIISKEIIRKRLRSVNSRIDLAIEDARKDIHQYAKLKKKHPVINMETLDQIASANKIKIVVCFKLNARSGIENEYETPNEAEHRMILVGKFFNEANGYILSNLTLILDESELNSNVYNSLNKKLMKVNSFIDAFR